MRKISFIFCLAFITMFACSKSFATITGDNTDENYAYSSDVSSDNIFTSTMTSEGYVNLVSGSSVTFSTITANSLTVQGTDTTPSNWVNDQEINLLIAGSSITVNNINLTNDQDLKAYDFIVNSTSTVTNNAALDFSNCIQISSYSTVNTNASNIKASSAIVNNGTLEFTGGTNGNNISGDGILNILPVAFVTNTDGFLIDQNTINIGALGTLMTSADDVLVTNKINNEGSILFTGGINSNVIDSSNGNITAGAGFINNGYITVGFENFNNMANTELTNNGSIYFIGTDETILQDVAGVGTFGISSGTFTNNAFISQSTITVSSIGTLNTSLNDIDVTFITNNGVVNFTSGTVNNNIILGAGVLNLGSDLINTATIRQGEINILADKMFTSEIGLVNSSSIAMISSNTLNLVLSSTNSVVVFGGKINSANGSTLNIDVADDSLVGFYNTITSSGTGNVINLNSQLFSSSTILLNADMSGFSGAGNVVNFSSGTLWMGYNSVFFNDVEFNMHGGTTLNLVNGKIDNIAVNLNLPDNEISYLELGVSLKNKEVDNFVGSALGTGNGSLEISKLYIYNDMTDIHDTVNVTVAEGALADKITFTQTKVMGPVFEYYTNYQNGILSFAYTYDYNPIVFITPIVMQVGGYLGQLESYRQAFEIVDNTVNNNNTKGLWLRYYGSKEDIQLDDLLTLTNTTSGAYFGYDTEVLEAGGNFFGNISFYGSYNTSEQTYEGAKITQNGGILGVTGALYKNRFFSALTVNFGFINGQGEGAYGKENTMIFTRGIASKTGFNFELDNENKFKFQPTLNLSYSYINMASYSFISPTEATVNVNTNSLTPVQLEPAMKLLANVTKTFQTYVNASIVWNLIDNMEFKANDSQLPNMPIKTYTQYGVGVNKYFGEKFTVGADLFGRAMGRTGFGGQVNIRYNF
ncbi:MAG: hypothetical protein PHR82_03995 [Endomicrobiaceae bacterium]|nr:hypothetical protein [Endomicrobiaceae bacterium]